MPAFGLDLTADGTTVGTGFLPATTRFTIRRVRCSILLHLQGSLASDDGVRIGIGLGVVSTDSALAGETPDPLGDPDWPWMWWKETFLVMAGGATNVTWVANTLGMASLRLEVDSKAQRKIKTDESLIWAIQYSDSSGTPPVGIDFGIARVLIGLH